MNYNILIATHPFGLCGDKHVKMLEETGWNIIYNSLGRRLSGNEVKSMLSSVHAVIAGTEPYTQETIKFANNLKVISRVGVGLDNIDFNACREKNIVVTYTPEAPADGVADLTVSQIINLLRGILISDKSVRDGKWNRILGKLVSEVKIGVMGAGRIGGRVINRLKSFGGSNIYVCDIVKKDINNVIWVSKEEMFKTCDVVTIHIPLNKNNYHCVGFKEMSSMKGGSFIVNTSRGPVIDETAIESLLYNRHLGGAAIDVFEKEPYSGVLKEFDNVILTAHIGASAYRSRFMMEYEAVEDCVRVLNGETPLRIAVEDE
jgi:D-3-phosphoglycerate dehydrogenase